MVERESPVRTISRLMPGNTREPLPLANVVTVNAISLVFIGSLDLATTPVQA